MPGPSLSLQAHHTTVKCGATLFIRQRKNSLFYKNPHSAYIASVLTSLIATCIYAGVNAVEYLVALQEHRGEVCADPAAWLPWAYASSRVSP
jgi:transposase